MANEHTNPLDDGESKFCKHCGEAYREVRRLPRRVGLCPTCFETELDGGEADTG
jgi:Zn-finger nucleic acid-binding protein